MKISNVRLPLLRGGDNWLDRSTPSRLRIRLDASDPEVPVGSYRLSFPVAMPTSKEAISPWNIWHLSLCADRDCLLTSDASVLVSFPLTGFNIHYTFASERVDIPTQPNGWDNGEKGC